MSRVQDTIGERDGSTGRPLSDLPVLWTIPVAPAAYHFPNTLQAGDFARHGGSLYFYTGSVWKKVQLTGA